MTNAYAYIKDAMRESLRKRMADWRAGGSIIKIDKPTDIGRARILGYKAKKGYVMVRVKLVRGGRKRSRPTKGRRSKRLSIRKVLKMNYRWVAEQRAERKFTNLEVLNSYMAGKDGMHYFFEVIMIDPTRPEIQSDSTINWICSPKNHGRAFRGLTSAAKKSRGLRTKSRNMKVRPSIRAQSRKGK